VRDSIESGPQSYATIIHPLTKETINVPFQGGLEAAKAFFEPLGIEVIRTWWMKRNWAKRKGPVAQ
jgi:hypothetical protein